MMLALAALAALPSAAAEPSPADAIKGCWQLRDTPGEVSLRAEDPSYASTVTYCFDEEVVGEFVTRAAEVNGDKDESGNGVDAGGDGWDGGGHYAIDGDRLRLDEGEGRTCAFAISGDVLTLSQCVADQTMATSEPIEDTTWDRVPQ
jgi:hypothetical protein